MARRPGIDVLDVRKQPGPQAKGTHAAAGFGIRSARVIITGDAMHACSVQSEKSTGTDVDVRRGSSLHHLSVIS